MVCCLQPHIDKIRKTYACILLSSRVNDRLITSQMGHTDIVTTRNIYYYNRKTADESKQVISNAISF